MAAREHVNGVEHLRGCDPVLGELIDRIGSLDERARRRGRPKRDAYGTLVRSIVGQQISTAAARTIFERLCALFGDRTPAPEELLEADPELLRGAGLSAQKVAYLRDLAARIADGDLDLDRLAELPDEGVIVELTEVKGLGRWTVEMFLMFHLGRPDVLPVGDLGIRRAAQRIYSLAEMPDPAALERLAEPWRPHRTLACLYLWRSVDPEPA